MNDTPKKTLRKMRYSESELAFLKSTFVDNDELVIALRRFFLQLPMTNTDNAIMASMVIGNKDMQAVLRRTFLPSLDAEEPLSHTLDLWMTIDLKDKDLDVGYVNIQSRQLVIEYIEQQLKKLEENKPEFIRLTDFVPSSGFVLDRTSTSSQMSEILARNTILVHTDMMLNQLVTLAGMNTETPDETKKRLAQDSTK